PARHGREYRHDRHEHARLARSLQTSARAATGVRRSRGSLHVQHDRRARAAAARDRNWIPVAAVHAARTCVPGRRRHESREPPADGHGARGRRAGMGRAASTGRAADRFDRADVRDAGRDRQAASEPDAGPPRAILRHASLPQRRAGDAARTAHHVRRAVELDSDVLGHPADGGRRPQARPALSLRARRESRHHVDRDVGRARDGEPGRGDGCVLPHAVQPARHSSRMAHSGNSPHPAPHRRAHGRMGVATVVHAGRFHVAGLLHHAGDHRRHRRVDGLAMSWKNVLSIFTKDDLFTQALHESHQMLDIALGMFDASVESLRRRDDGSIDIDIYKLDKDVNRFERDVRRKVMTHLAVSGPADLASGLVLVSVVIDIERIGDYAKNIYDLARWHPRRLHGGSLEPKVADIETRVGELFREMVTAFKQNGVDKARHIMVTYKEQLSAECEELVEGIVSVKTTDLAADDAAALVLYVRYLKRIAAHSRNLVSGLVNPFHRIGYREKKESSV